MVVAHVLVSCTHPNVDSFETDRPAAELLLIQALMQAFIAPCLKSTYVLYNMASQRLSQRLCKVYCLVSYVLVVALGGLSVVHYSYLQNNTIHNNKNSLG